MDTEAFLQGLIWVGNLNGTTLMGRNHATASASSQPLVAVGVGSNVVLVSDNHVRVPESWSSFTIDAQQGLFTNNVTNTNNSNVSQGVIKDSNPVIT